MNEIAAKLGEVGLPAPISELAGKDWDAIVVGGGHNGLTAAAYLAKAGKSVLVLERRERLGGACTLERPFEDDRFVVTPCAYVVGLLDDVVIDELQLRKRGLKYWMADPNLWVPFEDGTSFGQFLDDDRTQQSLDALGLSKQDVDGYWAYEELFDDVRKLLRQGARDTWIGDTPTRAEIEEILGHDQEKIDLVFEDSIADVLGRYIDDERLKSALFGQGVIGTWGGPFDHGTASIKLMHYQGDMDGQGPVWGYVEGGMGMISFAIADAAREAGAMLACDVPVARIIPGEGVELEDGTTHPRPDGDLQRRPEGDHAPRRRRRHPRGRSRLPRQARELEDPQPRRQVQRRARSAARTGPPPPARIGRPERPSTSAEPWRTPRLAFERCAAGEPAVGFGEIYVQTGYDPSPAPERQAADERVRPVRALRHRRRRLGFRAARASPGSSSS